MMLLTMEEEAGGSSTNNNNKTESDSVGSSDPAARTDTGDSPDRETVLARIEADKILAVIKAWEESEKTKVENRAYKRHTAIGLWEESKKASVEAKLKRIEEKLERKKAEYFEEMQNKIAEIHQVAEEERAKVEAQKGQDLISNYSSMDGALYCKAHFEQLFKENGAAMARKALSSGKPPNELARKPSRLASFFSGTQDKCSACKKTVYPLEKLTVEGEFYHKSCFRCTHGGCFLNPSSYAALDGFLYCKPHFSQLFKEKGSYSYLSKTASLKKHAEEEKTVAPETTTEAEPPKEEQDGDAPAITQE